MLPYVVVLLYVATLLLLRVVADSVCTPTHGVQVLNKVPSTQSWVVASSLPLCACVPLSPRVAPLVAHGEHCILASTAGRCRQPRSVHPGSCHAHALL